MKELQPESLIDAVKEMQNAASLHLVVRMQAGYDHSYFFISTFIEDHIKHHIKYLKS